MTASPVAAVCRRYHYVRADVYGSDDIRFVSIIISVDLDDALASDEAWELRALDLGHASVLPPSNGVQWNDLVVQL